VPAVQSGSIAGKEYLTQDTFREKYLIENGPAANMKAPREKRDSEEY